MWNSITKNDPLEQIKEELGGWYDDTICMSVHKALNEWLKNYESYGVTEKQAIDFCNLTLKLSADSE